MKQGRGCWWIGCVRGFCVDKPCEPGECDLSTDVKIRKPKKKKVERPKVEVKTFTKKQTELWEK